VATVNKDFKVKNGLAVVLGGSFGGTVTVATPTDALHAATKAYVDAAAGSGAIPVGSTFPASPVEGQLFIDSVTKRIHMYLNAAWIAVATLQDAEVLQDQLCGCGARNTSITSSSRSPSTALGRRGTPTLTTARGKVLGGVRRRMAIVVRMGLLMVADWLRL